MSVERPNSRPFLDLATQEYAIEFSSGCPYITEMYLADAKEVLNSDFSFADHVVTQASQESLIFPYGFKDTLDQHIRRRVAYFAGASVVFRTAQEQLDAVGSSLSEVTPHFNSTPYDRTRYQHMVSDDLDALTTMYYYVPRFGAVAMRFMSALNLMYGLIEDIPKDEITSVRHSAGLGFTRTLVHMEQAIQSLRLPDRSD